MSVPNLKSMALTVEKLNAAHTVLDGQPEFHKLSYSHLTFVSKVHTPNFSSFTEIGSNFIFIVWLQLSGEAKQIEISNIPKYANVWNIYKEAIWL